MNFKKILILLFLISLLSSCSNTSTDYTYKKTISEAISSSSSILEERYAVSEGFIIAEIAQIVSDNNESGEIIGQLEYGRKVKINSTLNGYHAVSIGKQNGFVKTSLVTETPPPKIDEDFTNLLPKGEAYIENVPVIPQFPNYPTGCESVTAVMALNFLGEDISVDEFINSHLEISNNFYRIDGVLYGPNPNEVFVGNPNIESSFGCMSPVIEKALIKYLNDETRVKRYTDVPLEQLCAKYIDNNIPVLVWVTTEMKPTFEGKKWEIESVGTYTWLSNEHCMLLVGYDENYYYMNDCYTGKCVAYDKRITEQRYNEFGCQAIAIIR